MKFHLLKEPETPWGDYSTYLQHGYIERIGGKVELTRAGPYVPPISFPMALIVTASFKSLLEKSELKGLSFKPVIKKRIVKINWQEWGDNPKYPASGEPEDYLGLNRKHNPAAAAEMEELFELVVKPGASLVRNTTKQDSRGNTPFEKLFELELGAYSGLDIFLPSGDLNCPMWIVSERGKDWLQKNAAGHMTFRELKTTGTPGAASDSKQHVGPTPPPDARFSISCDDRYLGTRAISLDSRHFGVEWRKGILEIWNIPDGKKVGELKFDPIPGQKASPDLSAHSQHTLMIKDADVFGVGMAQSKRYLLSGNWKTKTTRPALLLGKLPNNPLGKLCGSVYGDTCVFFDSGNKFAWYHDKQKRIFDLSVWPPKELPETQPITAPVHSMTSPVKLKNSQWQFTSVFNSDSRTKVYLSREGGADRFEFVHQRFDLLRYFTTPDQEWVGAVLGSKTVLFWHADDWLKLVE